MKAMPRSIFTLILLCLLVGWQGHSQRKPRIKGSRSPVTVSEDLPDFRFLRLTDDLEVEVRNGAPGYQLEVDDNLVDVLRFDVQDSTLEIASFYQVTSSKSLKIVVYARELNAVEAVEGTLFSEELINTDLMNARASGNARLRLQVRAGWMDLRLEDNSSADMRIESDTLSLQLGGRTDAKLYADVDGISASLLQNASLTLEGLCAQARMDATDNTSLKASRMQAEELWARLEESATGRVYSSTQANLDLSGQARLYLYGQPAILIRRFTDRAELHKEPE